MKGQRATMTLQPDVKLATKTCNWCDNNYYKGFECEHCKSVNSEGCAPGDMIKTSEAPTFFTETVTSSPTGGPSAYYDMPFGEWVTTNDMMEYLAEHKWGRYGIHLKDIFKGICRWGDKSGTTITYDAKKIIYYGVRILQLAVGRTEMRAYLLEILHDPQFKATSPDLATNRKPND